MTLQSSGAITMTEIDAEFGLGTNLNAYRGVTYWMDDGSSGTFSAGAISMSDFYSTRVNEPLDYSYLGEITATSGSISFGAASASRVIALSVCATWGSSLTINSATIGGVSATVACQVSKGGNSVNPTSAIVYANVPTGASGTVSLTFSNSPSTVRIRCYRIVGVATTPANTKTDSTGADSLSLAVPSSTGFVIGSSTQVNSGSQTWTGLTERTEYAGNSTWHSTGDSNGFAAAGSLSISASPANAGNGNSASAVWGR